MTMHVTTHLNFRGNARAALEFYQSVFGGDLTAFTYRDAQPFRNRPRPTRSSGARSPPTTGSG